MESIDSDCLAGLIPVKAAMKVCKCRFSTCQAGKATGQMAGPGTTRRKTGSLSLSSG